jgi:hypothetical protein
MQGEFLDKVQIPFIVKRRVTHIYPYRVSSLYMIRKRAVLKEQLPLNEFLVTTIMHCVHVCETPEKQ